MSPTVPPTCLATLAVVLSPLAAAQDEAVGGPVPVPRDPSTQEPVAQDPSPEPSAAAPRPDEDEIVVTARKWEEDPVDVPLSVTTIPGEALEDAGIRTVRDAALLVPNTNMTEFSARRLSFPVVRGIGSAQGEPAVTTYIDGVPQLTTGSTNVPLFDLDRIEFLRGPQGTLFGRNSTGGVIQIVTREPSTDPSADFDVAFGNYDFQEYRASYSGPIAAEDLFLNLTAVQSSRDGYTVNEFTGDRVDSRDGFFGRAQLVWRPSDHGQLKLEVWGERARDGAFVLSDLVGLRQTPNTINQDFQGAISRDVVAPSLTYEHFGGSVDFVSVTAFTGFDVEETTDFDFTAVDAVRRATAEDQDMVYQEFRLQSAEDADLRLGESWDMRWLLGLSGFAADSSRSAANEFRPDGAGIFFPPQAVGTDTQAGEFDDLAGAVFGQAAFVHDDRLELTAGLRMDVESKDASISRTFDPGTGPIPLSSQDLSETYSEPVPKFSAAYRFDDSGQVYAYAAKGFQAGGFNLAAPAGLESFDQETSWTYEVGVKKAFDRGLRVAASLFYVDWSDQQVSLFDPQAGGYVANVGQSTSRGAELELASEVVDGLDLFGNVGLNDTRIDEWTDPFGQDVAGNELPFAPRSTYALGAQYKGRITEDTGWYARVEWVGVGQFFYDAGNLEGEDYRLFNARLGFAWGPLQIDAWARNLFDERYVPIAFQPNPADPTQFVGESAAPRTYGFSLRGSI